MREPVGPTNSTITAHTLLSMVAVFALGSTRLLFSLLVGHHLGAEVLGRVNTQLSIAIFASLVIATSTSIAASKFVSAALGGNDPWEARRALLALLRWCSLGTAAATALLALVLSSLFDRFSGPEVAATCAVFVAYSGYLFVRGAMYGYGTVRRYALVESMCDGVAIAATVVVLLLDAELALLLPFTLGYTLFAVVGWVGLPHVTTPPTALALRTELRQEMLGYAGWAAVGVLSSTGFLQLSMLFAYHYSSDATAGLYAAALSLTVPAYFVPRALSMALFPAMASAFRRGDEEEISRQLDFGTRILLVATLPFFAGAVLLARPALAIIYGADFAAAHLVLELLLAATYILIVSIAAVNSLSATERVLVRVPAAAGIAGCFVGVLMWVVLGPVHSITGIAIGYLAGAAISTGGCMLVAWRRWRPAWSNLLLRVGLVAIFTVGLWLYVALRGDAVAIRFACVGAVTVATTLLCRSEIEQAVDRLRLVARQARAILVG